MGTLDTTRTFTLKSNQTGNEYLLSTTSNGSAAIMSHARTVSETSQWFATVTELKAYYRLHTVSTGRQFALAVVNSEGENSARLYMSKTDKQVPGQYWRFDEWEDGTGYRLSNSLTGLDMHLDVHPTTLEPHIAPGDRPGQHWTLWSSTTPGTKTHGEGEASSGHQARPGSAVAGIVIGAVSALRLALLAAWRMFRIKKRGKKKKLEPEPREPKPGPLTDNNDSRTDQSPVPQSSSSRSPWNTASTLPQELDGDPDAVSPLSPFSVSVAGRNRGKDGNLSQVYELPSPLAELPGLPVTRNDVK